MLAVHLRQLWTAWPLQQVQLITHGHNSCHAVLPVQVAPFSVQAEGDEVAAKLLATRRETMRLRSKIRDLKLQHARLREMKEVQQQQLQSSMECSGPASTVGQAAFCQHLNTPQDSGIACDRSDKSPSPASIAAESASESVHETSTSDTDCGDSDEFFS